MRVTSFINIPPCLTAFVVVYAEWQLLTINNVSMQQAVTDWWNSLSVNSSVATRVHSRFEGNGNNFSHTHFDCIWNASNPILVSATDDRQRCAYYKSSNGLARYAVQQNGLLSCQLLEHLLVAPSLPLDPSALVDLPGGINFLPR